MCVRLAACQNKILFLLKKSKRFSAQHLKLGTYDGTYWGLNEFNGLGVPVFD